jgi:hypothetical protein
VAIRSLTPAFRPGLIGKKVKTLQWALAQINRNVMMGSWKDIDVKILRAKAHRFLTGLSDCHVADELHTISNIRAFLY